MRQMAPLVAILVAVWTGEAGAQEDLAAKLNERASVIAKLENGTMRPNDALLKKLEHELGIKLTEKVSVVKPEAGRSTGKILTLGDMIKKK